MFCKLLIRPPLRTHRLKSKHTAHYKYCRRHLKTEIYRSTLIHFWASNVLSSPGSGSVFSIRIRIQYAKSIWICIRNTAFPCSIVKDYIARYGTYLSKNVMLKSEIFIIQTVVLATWKSVEPTSRQFLVILSIMKCSVLASCPPFEFCFGHS